MHCKTLCFSIQYPNKILLSSFFVPFQDYFTEEPLPCQEKNFFTRFLLSENVEISVSPPLKKEYNESSKAKKSEVTLHDNT